MILQRRTFLSKGKKKINECVCVCVFTEVMSGLSYLIGSEVLGEDVQMVCTAESIRARSDGWQD